MTESNSVSPYPRKIPRRKMAIIAAILTVLLIVCIIVLIVISRGNASGTNPIVDIVNSISGSGSGSTNQPTAEVPIAVITAETALGQPTIAFIVDGQVVVKRGYDAENEVVGTGYEKEFSPDKNYLLYAAGQYEGDTFTTKEFRVYNLQTRTNEKFDVALDPTAYDLESFSPTGDYVRFHNRTAKTFAIVSFATRQVVQEFPGIFSNWIEGNYAYIEEKTDLVQPEIYTPSRRLISINVDTGEKVVFSEPSYGRTAYFGGNSNSEIYAGRAYFTELNWANIGTLRMERQETYYSVNAQGQDLQQHTKEARPERIGYSFYNNLNTTLTAQAEPQGFVVDYYYFNETNPWVAVTLNPTSIEPSISERMAANQIAVYNLQTQEFKMLGRGFYPAL